MSVFELEQLRERFANFTREELLAVLELLVDELLARKEVPVSLIEELLERGSARPN